MLLTYLLVSSIIGGIYTKLLISDSNPVGKELTKYFTNYQTPPTYDQRSCSFYTIPNTSSACGDLTDQLMSKNGCPNTIPADLQAENDYEALNIRSDFILLENTKDLTNVLSEMKKLSWKEKKRQIHFMFCTSVTNPQIFTNNSAYIWNEIGHRFAFIFVQNKLRVLIYNYYSNEVIDIANTKHSLEFTLENLNNLFGHKVVINIFRHPPLLDKENGTWIGEDYNFMKSVIEKYNATPSYEEVGDEKFTLVTKNLYNRKVDICGVSAVLYGYFNNVDHTYPHKWDQLVVIVPRSPKDGAHVLFITYGGYNKLLALTIISLTLTLVLISRVKMQNKSAVSYILEIWAIYNQVAVVTLEKKNFLIRFLQNLWIISSMILVIYFQSLLYSSLSTKTVINNITSLAELRESQLPLYISPAYNQVLPRDFGLSNQTIISDFNEIYGKLKNRTPGIAAIVTKSEAATYIYLSRNEDKGHFYYTIPQSILNCFNFYYIQRNSPLKTLLDRNLQLLRSDGYQERRTRIHETLHGENYYQNEVPTKTKLNLIYSFNLLILGLILSTIAFIGELFVHRYFNV